MRTFAFAVCLYALTLVLGVLAASERISIAQIPVSVPQFTVTDLFIFVGVFVLMTFLMLRFGRASRLSLGILLTLAVFAGGMFIFGAWLPWPLDILAAGIVTFATRFRPRVLPHDLGVAVGIAGISGLLGLALTPLWAVCLLAFLSVYDIISVYRTRHMVALAGRMLESGFIFGFLIPSHLRTFKKPVADALTERSVMVLGSGDVGLPLVLAASSVATSLNAAFFVVGGALIGLSIMQWLFVHQRRAMPMAALPPIAVFSIIAYVVAVTLGV
ncbi:MAG TPA: presenilin family intramembrane aspartyl protease [Candidatus Paceibacterota bacterium]|nr:presenilin family intramembrane aspartyl protease [Candidatus Paceibacterota bacterium]